MYIINTDNIETDWKDILSLLWDKHKDKILQVIGQEKEQVFPNSKDIFRAFEFFNQSDLRVVILAQDPYINPGEANGLCFSVNPGCKMPPSLRNVFKEIERTYDKRRTDTDLQDWARQGVLLLNTALTVRQSKSGSHVNIWKPFICDLMEYISKNCEGVVFMLWGVLAKSYGEFFDGNKNLILTHSHPSPLARKPFVGNDHFKLCNQYLKGKGFCEICWV
jgi:uracil-DNA glycosylase